MEEKSIIKKKTQSIINKTNAKTQRKENLKVQKGVLKDALWLYDQRTVIINAFVNKNVYLGDAERDVYYTPEKVEPELSFEESILETSKMRRQKSLKKKVKKDNG